MLPIEHLNFIAGLLGFFALVHLRWPGHIKLVIDRLAEEIGSHWFDSNYDQAYYFGLGRIYALAAGAAMLAILMTLVFG